MKSYGKGMVINMNWLAVTDSELRKKVLGIVKEGAKRLTDPEKINKDMIKLTQVRMAAGAEYVPWYPLDLARGYSGFCVLFGELDRLEPDGGWDVIGHGYLQKMQEILMNKGTQGLGLWNGLSGVIMATRGLSRDGERYTNFISELNAFFLKQFPSMLQHIEAQLKQGASLQEFDVIQGLSGIGRYLLCFTKKQEMKNALEQVLSYLVTLCQDREWNKRILPGWFSSPENQYVNDTVNYPNGHFNCGMSHGIPGVLALLSIALLQGIEIKGQREAIYNIGEWLMKWKGEDAFGPLWPSRVSMEEFISGQAQNLVPREAWCYGGPGLARSLWLSGTALNQEEWKATALYTFRGTARRPKELWNIDSHTCCHGLAGLLQMVQRMYSDSGDELVGKLRNQLLEQVLKLWNPEEPYGYHEAKGSDKQHLAGLLDGAAGVFTVLIGLVQEQESDWDCVFLIQ